MNRFYQVKARNCRTQNSRANPLFFHCGNRSTEVLPTGNAAAMFARSQFLTQNAAQRVRTRQICRNIRRFKSKPGTKNRRTEDGF